MHAHANVDFLNYYDGDNECEVYQFAVKYGMDWFVIKYLKILMHLTSICIELYGKLMPSSVFHVPCSLKVLWFVRLRFTVQYL